MPFGENDILITPIHRPDLQKTITINNDCSSGDVTLDGAVNILDLVMLVSFIVGNISFNDTQIILADFNNDSFVDILDITTIIYIIVNG